jgi:hypothetical protein
MTNLFPATTGLPVVVWVGPSYGAPHDVRVKVMQAHGTRMDPGNLAVVALWPRRRGRMSSPAGSRPLISEPLRNGSRSTKKRSSTIGTASPTARSSPINCSRYRRRSHHERS